MFVSLFVSVPLAYAQLPSTTPLPGAVLNFVPHHSKTGLKTIKVELEVRGRRG